MTQISSKLSVAGTDDPIVTTAQVPRLAGAFLFLGRTEFDAAVTAERTRITNNTIGIYANGQPIRVVGEQPVYRKWTLATGGSAAANAAASHANTVVIRPGLEVTLAADTNVVLIGSGAAGGNNGDIFVDFGANTISTKSAGVWSVTTAAIYSGSGGSTTIANNLTTNAADQALSAAQGVVLKAADDALTAALAGKQATLVSATNIKTVNGTSLLGAGDITIAGGTTIANNLITAVAGSALDAVQGKALKDTADALATTVTGKQASLVSGTNIKSVNGTSLLGSGDLTVTAAGVLNYINATVGKFLASQDNAGASPGATTLGTDSIDIQTVRLAGFGALGSYDVVIGANAGIKGAASGGTNLILGATSRIDNARVGSSRNIALAGGRINGPAAAVPIGLGTGNVAIYGVMSGASVGNIVIGSSTLSGSFALTENQNVSDSIAIGSNNAYYSNFSAGQVKSSSVVGMIGYGHTINGLIDSVFAFGSTNTIGDPGSDTSSNNNVIVIGNGLEVLGGENELARIGLVNGTGSSYATIDIKLGTDVNTNKITLGEGIYDATWGATGGANVVIGKAISFLGKVFLASSATQVVIPDNCSHAIITGTTNTPLKLPTNPIDGQELNVIFAGTQTPLSWATYTAQFFSTGSQPSGVMNAGTSVKFIYHATPLEAPTTVGRWYRMH